MGTRPVGIPVGILCNKVCTKQCPCSLRAEDRNPPNKPVSESTKSLKTDMWEPNFPQLALGCLPGFLSQCTICHDGEICTTQGECTETNKEHGKHSLVMRHGKWDATSAHEWRCFKRVEKNREPYPSKTHFQLTAQPTGLMAQFFPNP